MYHYIQGNKSNEWIPAIESQINVLNEILKTKQNITFTITDPVSNKSFESVCTFENNFCMFKNLETGKIRKAISSESKLTCFPNHKGA